MCMNMKMKKMIREGIGLFLLYSFITLCLFLATDRIERLDQVEGDFRNTNTSVSISVNSKVLSEVQEKFATVDFDSIETISFEKLKSEYYYVKYNEEKIDNSISEAVWKKYSKIGDIEDNIKLKLLKANYQDGIVSLRYKNNISQYIPSMQLAAIFTEQLISDGYKEVLNSSSKAIYENEDYKIIIMDEFDYLIIVMVRL